ncbi:MAG: hypothetical protein Q9224_005040, partial [Gallowayella concinna]
TDGGGQLHGKPGPMGWFGGKALVVLTEKWLCSLSDLEYALKSYISHGGEPELLRGESSPVESGEAASQCGIVGI